LLLVEELKDKREWEDFLHTCPGGTFYHGLLWREVLERSFHEAPVYLTVRDANQIVGICPGFILEFMRSKIYSSMPYSDYGGPVIASRCADDASLSLRQYLQRFCSSMGVGYLKINFANEELERSYGSQFGYTSKSGGAVEIDLNATPSNFIWNSIFSGRRRKKMKRFERDGYHAQQAQTKSDLRDFYGLYYGNMKHIGARPYSYDFLENMWDLLYPLNLRIWLVEREEAIGGILVLKDNGGSYWFLAGIDRRQDYSRYPVVNYLFWQEIQAAEEDGIRLVSLGSTRSDQNDPYYLQKTSFGGSFRQQIVAYYPCNSTARFLLEAREKAYSGWMAARAFLPIRLKRFVERRV
jgi:hypothetical protein